MDYPEADYGGAWAELRGYVQQAADDGTVIEPAAMLSISPAVIFALADWLDKIAWMVGLDRELLARVGCDEALATAREILGTEEVPCPPR